MSTTEEFLTSEEEKAIVEAIHIAEKNTSGEIRVHIESETEKPPLERAKEVFIQLKMNLTKERNGVLFYVNVSKKSFAILGDEGIDKMVSNHFWDETKNIVVNYFKLKHYKKGLVEGILHAGEQLKHHFPYSSDDIDELSNEISKS